MRMLNMLIQNMTNRIISNNPEARQFYESMKGKSPAELKQYAENVAQGRNINLREFLKQYNITVQ